jgi:hypothetical protein
MDELETMDAAAEDEMDPQADGSTFILGPEGWETAEFIDPEDDWRLLADGSYLSPDGATRSWPLIGPEPL